MEHAGRRANSGDSRNPARCHPKVQRGDGRTQHAASCARPD